MINLWFCLLPRKWTISCSSKKQLTVALSRIEAKYRGAAVVACEAVWLKKILKDLGVPIKDLIPLYCDYEQYSSGSEPNVPCTHEAYRSVVSLHLRARSGWRCRHSTHQPESPDTQHLHVKPWINNPWLAKVEGEYKLNTIQTGYQSKRTSTEEDDQSWAWGGVLRIKLNPV